MATAMAHRKRAAQWRPAKCRVGPPAAHAVFRRGADVHRAVPEIVRDAQPAHKGWRVANPGTRSCPTGTAARPWKPTLPPQPRGWGLKGRIVKPRPLPARQGAVSTAPRPAQKSWRVANPGTRSCPTGTSARPRKPTLPPQPRGWGLKGRIVKPRPLPARYSYSTSTTRSRSPVPSSGERHSAPQPPPRPATATALTQRARRDRDLPCRAQASAKGRRLGLRERRRPRL